MCVQQRYGARLLGLGKAVVEGVEFDEDEQAIIVSVHPRKATRRRCGRCGKRCPGYDQGKGRRWWRALDLGTIQTFLEADSPRVRCAEHGVVAAQVPWALHDAGHTYAFDDTAAWLVTHCSKSAVRDLLRIAWRTVGSIVTRVVADAETKTDRFAGLRRIGIDEISYKRGHFSGDPKLSLVVSLGGDERGSCRSFCIACATWLPVRQTNLADPGEDATSRAQRDARVLDSR